MAGTAQQIRDLLAAGKTINMPGVYDALTARLASEAGFEVVFISGYSVSGSRLGLPDFGYLTQTEVADAARSVCSATDLPVIVDADTGYGNPLSAMRTARLLAGAGGAGIFLEDQEWPKKCGHFAGKRVVLFLVARTDARAAVSLDEAIDRARAARDLGVDAIFVEAPEGIDDLERVAKEVEGVVRVANMIEGGRTPLLTPQELHDLGYDLIVTPLSAIFAAARAVREAFAVLRREGTLRGHRELLLSFSEFEPVVDLAGHRSLEERYRS